MRERLVGATREKGVKRWSVRAFTYVHKDPIKAMQGAHAACEDYIEAFPRKRSDYKYEWSIIDIEIQPLLVFQPFDMAWVSTVTLKVTALRKEKKHSLAHTTEELENLAIEPIEDIDFSPIEGEKMYTLIAK